MIVCRDCGHQNEADDQFCGSCGSFLEFTGDRITPEAPVARVVEADEPESEFLLRAKRALAVDNASMAQTEATDARVVDEDAALAARVIAEREAEAAAREAEAAAAAQRKADEEAAQRLAESERAKAEADERAAQAERDLEAMRREREAEEARKVAEIEAARVAAEKALAEKLQAAEEKARAEAAQAQRELEERLKDQEAAAEVARREAAEAVRRAHEAEQVAEQERVAAQQRLEEAAAAAAAAALRASQENDALAAAEAARLSSEAEAARSRAESAAAAASAAEEVAKAKAEAEAARAEAAELRAKAEAEAARTELERRQLTAEREAAEEAAVARRRVEEQAEADRQRAIAEAEAAAVRAKAEAEAAERKAEAELEARQAEAKAAQARAEEERARSAAEAEAAKREREEALRKAAALVATPKAETPAASVKSPAASKPAAAAKAPATPKGDSTVDPSAKDTAVPEARLPGSVAARQAPKRAASAELNVGDVVCGQCGAGNVPTRKFCRKCGTSLAEAQPVKLGFFAKLRVKANERKRRKRETAAGTRPGRNGAPGVSGLKAARGKGRQAWWKLNTSLLRVGALVGILAMFGLGVEPIRAKLHLPNVRQKVLDTIRRTATPVYDPVRAVSAAASSAIKGNEAGNLIDLANNTTWLAAPTDSGGVGSSITIGFDKPFDLGRVLLTSGLAGSTEPDKGFVSQPRPSELRVIFNDDDAAPVTVSVKDSEQPQTLKLSHKDTTKVRFEITGVYPAANGKGKSVAITEMEFFQKRKFGDDYETLQAPTIVAAGKIGALTDDDLSTAWVSADAANGVGQGFSIVFDTPTDIDRLRIAPGQASDVFQSLPRPDDVQLAFTCQGICDATKQVSFADKPGYKSIGLKAKGVTKIDVLVRSVHGSGGGVAFADLQIQRKRPTTP